MMQDLLQSVFIGLAQVSASAPEAQALVDAAPNVPVMTQEAASSGMLHFIGQSDWVGKSLFVVLALMSLASWYLIFVKAFLSMRLKRRSKHFLREFWAASSLEQV
ncbi:MAG TPA: MotA/TolQ/ExbB proton channel family protein, partial [Paenalcaligenes sp.]|nr:MotA/TolQ/ExbB proton channel family protein [Paenalcaligenes sp.]